MGRGDRGDRGDGDGRTRVRRRATSRATPGRVAVLALLAVLTVVPPVPSAGSASDAGVTTAVAATPDGGADRADGPDGADAAAVPAGRYGWPLRPRPAVVRPFRAPDQPDGAGHRGVDLAGAVGQPVLAAHAGTVVFAGLLAGRGVVSVQHDDGLRTTYEPVVAAVRAGQAVRRGEPVGTLAAGHGGCPGPCLHWGVRRDRLVYVDPLVLVRPLFVRLLPLPPEWPPRAD